jgi:hypothetical protein
MYKNIRNYENINKGRYEICGKYDIPILKPTHGNADQWIGFNYAKSCKNPGDKGVHFFWMITSLSGCGIGLMIIFLCCRNSNAL